jgi:hypothetical protein
MMFWRAAYGICRTKSFLTKLSLASLERRTVMSESFRDNSNEANGYSGKSMTWQRFHRLAWRNISHCPFMISVGLASSSPAY